MSRPAAPPAPVAHAHARQRSRREWIVLAGITVFVLGALAYLTFQEARAARTGFLSGFGWRYLQSVVLLVLIFALFTLGLSLEFGHTGLINFGHVAFLGIGAYTASIVAWHVGPALYEASLLPALGWSLLIVVIAASVAAAFALLLGIPTLKLREDYLAIVTIGAAEILRMVWLNEEDLTNGPSGLSVRIPGAAWVLDEENGWASLFEPLRAGPLRIQLDPYYSFLILLTLVALAASYIIFERLARSPWGRVVRAIREDEDVAAALGKNVFVYKLQALVLGSVVAALAGILYAWFARFVTPDSFLPLITFYAWIILVVGGVGNHKGVLAGALILWGVFEMARNLPALEAIGLSATAGPQQVVFIGVLLILIMMFRPQGAMGRKEEMLFGK